MAMPYYMSILPDAYTPKGNNDLAHIQFQGAEFYPAGYGEYPEPCYETNLIFTYIDIESGQFAMGFVWWVSQALLEGNRGLYVDVYEDGAKTTNPCEYIELLDGYQMFSWKWNMMAINDMPSEAFFRFYIANNDDGGNPVYFYQYKFASINKSMGA